MLLRLLPPNNHYSIADKQYNNKINMKKSFKLAAIAAIASLTIVACNNNNTEATDTIDSTAIEQVVEEQEMIAEPAEVLDTTPVVEEQKATATVKATKKEQAKPVVKEEAKAEATAAPATTTPSNLEKNSAPVQRKRR